MVTFKVSDFNKFCSTRERGKKFYFYLKNLISSEVKYIILDFEDIEHVSISFLDESVIKLINEGYKLKIITSNPNIIRKIKKDFSWRNISKNLINEENNKYYFV
ncbi:MAG: DUF4325 domain-containing protein [Candidatus Helarchaeota archaeon]|nr:DUF4325 domain-containing protein [Candidatus Helarchaeota archaeon]